MELHLLDDQKSTQERELHKLMQEPTLWEDNFSDYVYQIMQDKYLEPNQTISTRLFDVAHYVLHNGLNKETDYEIAKVDQITRTMHFIMLNKLFLPNSPTLASAGRTLNQLAACFVVPVGDSMESIFGSALPDLARIQRSGGGTGFDFSALRPEGAPVSSTKGTSSGPISFMQAFNACTDTIKQGGTRRGANMGIMHVAHPDIRKFIKCKQDQTSLTNFNLSVAISDEFMEAVKGDNFFCLRWPIDDPDAPVYETVKARELFNEIAEAAHRFGEPGVVFIDRINQSQGDLGKLGKIYATNPCGEQPLLPNEACILGSINVAQIYRLVNYDMTRFWNLLDEVTALGTLFLDCCITVNTYPTIAIDKAVKKTRKIGLGIMGLHDLLILCNLSYDSSAGLQLARCVADFITKTSHKVSKRLAETFGAFPGLLEIYPGLDTVELERCELHRRNALTTTIAPTGTLSLIAGCSSGIEPLFALSYRKQFTEGGYADIVTTLVKEYILHCNHLITTNSDDRAKLAEEAEEHIVQYGTLSNFKLDNTTVPYRLFREAFKTASEITPKDHIRMQATLQRHIDNAISKTINMPNDQAVEDVAEAFYFAYKQGCKGLTVYRDGSRDSQPLTSNSKEIPKEDEHMDAVSENISTTPTGTQTVLDRPANLYGVTRRIPTGCGFLYTTLNMDKDNKLFELLVQNGSSGGCNGYTEALARLVTTMLRAGIPAEEVIEQLCKVRCDNFRYQVGKNPELKGKSCPHVIGAFMQEYQQQIAQIGIDTVNSTPLYPCDPSINTACTKTNCFVNGGPCSQTVQQEFMTRKVFDSMGNEHTAFTTKTTTTAYNCPECKAPLWSVEGCYTCPSCGYSKCN